MKQVYFIIDVAKCENCNNCLLACKDEHVDNDWPGIAAAQPSLGQRWVNVQTKERGTHPMMDVAYLPMPCQHCADAPCVKAGKGGAVYHRPDGIVIIDPVKAKGQEQIAKACPYGAIYWNAERALPQKCTLCAHLLDNGWRQPRCVQVCPSGALDIRRLDKTELSQAIEEEGLQTWRPELKTSPHVLYKNLYRFTRCFIGGSVVINEGGAEECAAGAAVTLRTEQGDIVGAVETDTYGEFRFDDLAADGTSYSVAIELDSYPDKHVDVTVTDTLYLGVIRL